MPSASTACSLTANRCQRTEQPCARARERGGVAGAVRAMVGATGWGGCWGARPRHPPRRLRPMSTTAVPVPPVLATLIGRLAAAVPGRARATFTELLIGAAVTRGGHVTDAILAVGLSRAWTTCYWLLERGRWSWLSVW